MKVKKVEQDYAWISDFGADLPSIMATGVDVPARLIYLMGEINNEVAYRFMVALQTLDRIEGDIRIILTSVGGEEDAGYAIYDAIRLSKNKVIIEGYGAVQSIAALIIQAGNVRLLSPECRFMVHNGSLTLSEGIEADTLVAIGKEVLVNNARYHSALATRSGQTIHKIRKLCKDETFFTAQEAVYIGLADRVMKIKKKG